MAYRRRVAGRRVSASAFDYPGHFEHDAPSGAEPVVESGLGRRKEAVRLVQSMCARLGVRVLRRLTVHEDSRRQTSVNL